MDRRGARQRLVRGARRLQELLRRLVRAIVGPVPEPSPLAAGPDEVFLVAMGAVTTLVPLRPLSATATATAAESGSGDFGSRTERERLLSLPPIDVRSLATVDWDELARELTRGA